jgi:hypothetical protein
VTSLLPAERPACERHGPMVLRGAAELGVWYDCGQCRSSALLPSSALSADLARQALATGGGTRA